MRPADFYLLCVKTATATAQVIGTMAALAGEAPLSTTRSTEMFGLVLANETADCAEKDAETAVRIAANYRFGRGVLRDEAFGERMLAVLIQ